MLEHINLYALLTGESFKNFKLNDAGIFLRDELKKKQVKLWILPAETAAEFLLSKMSIEWQLSICVCAAVCSDARMFLLSLWGLSANVGVHLSLCFNL